MDDKTVQFNVTIPDELAQNIKLYSVLTGMTQAQVIQALADAFGLKGRINQELRKRDKESGK